MTHSAKSTQDNILDELVKKFSGLVPREQADAFSEFIRRLYAMDSRSELDHYQSGVLEGLTQTFWELIQHIDVSTPIIRVFNPTVRDHGWSSAHTIIYILHRDMPFLLDSLRMMLNTQGHRIYNLRGTVLEFSRDADHKMVFSGGNPVTEAAICVEINRIGRESELSALRERIANVFLDVASAVDDYRPMCSHVEQLIDALSGEQYGKVREFLRWLLSNNFTLLGYEELVVSEQGGEKRIARLPEKSFGLLCDEDVEGAGRIKLESFIERDFFEQREPITFSKAAVKSTVHRPAYPDFITVRWFGSDGNVAGEARIVGLYTSPVYRQSALKIPLISEKTRAVIERSGLDLKSHHGKDLEQILEVYPRDELFQSTENQLFDSAMSILQLQERRQIRLFIRQDPYGSFCSALVYVPRDVYSSGLRTKMEKILCERLSAVGLEFTTYYSESILVRVHFVLKLQARVEFDQASINEELVRAARSWSGDVRMLLVEGNGETEGERLADKYISGFSAAYREAFSPTMAVDDIDHFEKLSEESPLSTGFYQSPADPSDRVHFRLYHHAEPMPLAAQIPVIRNLGLDVMAEYPYSTSRRGGEAIWIHDFTLEAATDTPLDAEALGEPFMEAFQKVWLGEAENDGFNLLVVACGLNWRQVVMIRSYARYLKQINVGFSQRYVSSTLRNNSRITQLLVELFETRFDPAAELSLEQRQQRQQQAVQAIEEALEQVNVLSEDRVIRLFLSVVQSTVRTNFYQQNKLGNPKNYVSFKISSRNVVDIPKPAPLFEIFVYSPRMEGVHLRGGKVARGGLRWSDRVEDFRTEVLGLVKAQQVKNAVIVPVGAKGGFVAKRMPTQGGREAIQQEGIACYRQFIRALLDVTDNLVGSDVVHPQSVVYYDQDDPYLVVAADKGTATFSDIANEIAAEFDFWLGDAFASGGSVGYDHKKMGITAKGGWVSVQRHFRDRGVNVQKDTVYAIGIGDMSGDVFGNGMLLSESLAMVAAFNHLDIFIDPNPDIGRSFAERKRLFGLDRSTWQDYDTGIISKGGGIFSRQLKSIDISAEMRERFDITESQLTPNELISALLKSPVDLIWNGGIGTYIKASGESHEAVGDKANDTLRVDGRDVRARSVGEGGNLGLSQLGRIEYALQGGALNTDFIDNSAGVDCSDHEVNIKILLNGIVASGSMTVEERNTLLESMTDDVAELVLQNNYRQTQALSLAESDVSGRMDEYRRFMEYLEGDGKLDRAIEFLPDNEAIAERVAAGQGLTRPELSLLISYSKADLKEELVGSDVMDDPVMVQELYTTFPAVLVDRFAEQIDNHRLRREIVATQVANRLVDMVGITYVLRLRQTTGATVSQIARAFRVSCEVFGVFECWEAIEQLDYHVSSELQQSLMRSLIVLVRRASSWFIRIKRQDLAVQECVDHYRPKVANYMDRFVDYLEGDEKKLLLDEVEKYVSQDVPERVAMMVCAQRYVLGSLPVIQASDESGSPMERVAEIYYALVRRLELGWYSVQIGGIKTRNHWQLLARDSIRDELIWQQRGLTVALLKTVETQSDIEDQLDQWVARHRELVVRWQDMLADIRNTPNREMSMFTVANRELMDLAQASIHSARD